MCEIDLIITLNNLHWIQVIESSHQESKVEAQLLKAASLVKWSVSSRMQ